MSTNAISRFGCIIVAILLLATVATSVAESTPSDNSSSNSDEVKPNPGNLPVMCYSNGAYAETKFGNAYASVAIGTWRGNWTDSGYWSYEYGLDGLGTYEASRIFGAKFEIKEVDNPDAMRVKLGVDENSVWSTNGSDGSQMAISNAAEAIIGWQYQQSVDTSILHGLQQQL